MMPTVKEVPRALLAPMLDFNLARRLMDFAALAYEPNPGPDIEVIRSKKTNARAIIGRDGNCIVVGFKGSRQVKDFVQDAKFIRKDIGRGMAVHEGFFEDVESIVVEIATVVRGLNRPLLLCGHSLGADEAILFAWLCVKINLPVHAVYAFAPARPGNAAFAAAYNDALGDRTFCFVNRDDPVPMLPPLSFGARRCGQIVFWTGRKWKLNPTLVRMAWMNLRGAWNSWRHGRLAFLPNHIEVRYIDNLAHA